MSDVIYNTNNTPMGYKKNTVLCKNGKAIEQIRNTHNILFTIIAEECNMMIVRKSNAIQRICSQRGEKAGCEEDGEQKKLSYIQHQKEREKRVAMYVKCVQPLDLLFHAVDTLYS